MSSAFGLASSANRHSVTICRMLFRFREEELQHLGGNFSVGREIRNIDSNSDCCGRSPAFSMSMCRRVPATLVPVNGRRLECERIFLLESYAFRLVASTAFALIISRSKYSSVPIASAEVPMNSISGRRFHADAGVHYILENVRQFGADFRETRKAIETGGPHQGAGRDCKSRSRSSRADTKLQYASYSRLRIADVSEASSR